MTQKHLSLTACILAFFLNALQAQGPANKQAGNMPNFKTIKAEAESYYKETMSANGKEEDDAFSKYKRWEWFWEPRVGSAGNFPKPGITWEEWKKYVQSHSSQIARTASLSGSWSSMGPATTPGGYTGQGRVSCMGFHNTDPNTFWVGTPAGGLWKTTDGGVSWTTNTDNSIPVLGVSDIAIDPTNMNNMYIATGDGDIGGLYAINRNGLGDTKSVGVLKSTDGGATWNATGLSFGLNNYVTSRRIVMIPGSSGKLVVATAAGLYRTGDAGVSWSKVATGFFIDIAVNPANPAIVYASTYNYAGNAQVYTSTDTANTFTQSTNFTDVSRIKLAVTPANPKLVHALCSQKTTQSFDGLYVSRDNGATFSVLFSSGGPNLLSNDVTGSGTSGQGDYDLAYAISPVDTNLLFVGGVNIWKSSDGGKTFVINATWDGDSINYSNGTPCTVHADKHAMYFHPLNSSIFFNCNDGGIYKTSNAGSTYADLSNGLVISEATRLAVSATNANITIAGFQDNGTRIDSAGHFRKAEGGDGEVCQIDPTNPMNMYASYVYGKIYGSTDGFASYGTISSNIGAITGAWVTPFMLNPQNPSGLIAGFADVYRTPDMGSSWNQISTNLTGSSTTYLNSLCVAPSDSNTIYAGTYDSLYVTTNGGTSWKSAGHFASGLAKTSITVHPTTSQTVWVTISGYSAGNKVFKSTDGGGTWTNVSGTLPNLPVNCMVYEKGSNDGLYIGTDVGVYYTNASMSDWVLYSTGLPNVPVTQLVIQYSSSELRAATYGRGLWKSDLFGNSTGIKESISETSAVLIYPNPNKGSFTISLSDFKGADRANLYNYLGETLKVIDIRTPSQGLDISAFPDGVYYISLDSEHYSKMHRIVKLN